MLAAPLLLLPLLAGPAWGAPAATPETLAYETHTGIAVSSPPEASPVHVPGSQPAVSPDGTRLAWVAGWSGSPGPVLVGAPDGSGARTIARDGSAPRWLPDGRLVYTDRTGSARVAAADGSSDVPLAHVPSGSVWSPDGRFFVSNDGAGNVTVADAAGRGPVVLTRNLQVTDWSPDGRQLAGAHGGIRLYRLGDRTVSTVVANDNLRQARFAASGRQIYLSKDMGTFERVPRMSLERWSVEGMRDTTFPPRAMEWGGFSVGGGDRARPAVTSPRPVTGLTATAAPSRVTLRFARQTAPDTAGVTVRYAVGSTPPATVTDGVEAGESLASVLTVERLAPSTTYSFAVFTRDWSGAASPAATVTARTPAKVGTGLSLTGPGALTFGEPATLSGRLVRRDTGAGVAGARVQLLGRHTGGPDYPLVTLVTDREGRFATRRLTSQASRYTVRYAGSGPLDRAEANALVLVRQRITFSFSPSSQVPARSPASVTVTVAPAFPGGNVRVQQHSFFAPCSDCYSTVVNVLTRLDARSRATVRLDTSQRNSGDTEVVVTPGARRGYLTDPSSAFLGISWG
jgi:hypothetical protein